MTSTLDIRRFSRDDFIVYLGQRMEDLGYPIRMESQYIAQLRRGDIALSRRKAETLMEMLELTTSEKSEFRRHFYGGD